MFRFFIFIIVNLLLSFQAYSMSCGTLLQDHKNITTLVPSATDEVFFETAAILEEAMFSNDLDFKSVKLGEFLPDQDNGVIYMSSYIVSLKNDDSDDKFILQFKYIIRKPQLSYHFVVSIIEDSDSKLYILEEGRYDLLASFLGYNFDDYDDHNIAGFTTDYISLKFIMEDEPRAVEVALFDHTDDYAEIEYPDIYFQRILRVLMSNFSLENIKLH